MRHMKRIFFIVLIGLCLISGMYPEFNGSAYGEPEIPTATEMPQNTVPPEAPAVHTLKAILESRDNLRKQIKNREKALLAALSADEKAGIEEDIKQLNRNLAELENNFEEIATGISLSSMSRTDNEKFNWEDEVLNLLTPLVKEMKKMTERPRQLENLRSQIVFYEKQSAEAQKAISNLEIVVKQTGEDGGPLKKQLATLRKGWQNKLNQIENQLKVSRYQLDEISKQKESLWDATQSAVQGFFKSRGRNFVTALSVFILVFLLLRYLYQMMNKYSPIHKTRKRTFLIRLVDVLYLVLLVIGASGAALTVLYISGDWLLLSFVIIFLLGLTWTAKEGLPRYWRQVQLMLNLGTVRENERIVYNGVLWRVSSLGGFYAHLENRAFRPGFIKVPLRDMLNLNSRTWDSAEPWFPCNIGEWVILSDGTWGEVISQTPEMVHLTLRGGSRKSYLTGDFLGQNPLNISKGFRLKVIFGFDYADQAIITTEIPEKLTDHLKKSITEMGHGDDIQQLKVEVECAGASSLDLLIIADFLGRAAPFHNILRRAIQKFTIEACTANGWNIPFTQMVIHKADQD